MPSLEERINARTAVMPSGCIEWQGCVDPAGYGRISFEGKVAFVHREAYRLKHGSIPAGKFILHSCDNPPCCNPEHLRAGTQAENMQDRTARGRSGKTGNYSKVPDDMVRHIRALHAEGMTQMAIFRLTGVTQPTISKMVRGLEFTRVK